MLNNKFFRHGFAQGGKMKKKRLLIVDDHPLFREGLKAIIRQNSGYEVAGEADNGKTALNLARKLQPDLVITDISLPDISGIFLITEIRKVSLNTLVMVMSMYTKITFVTEAFQAGAMGYVAKESAAENLLKGIDEVMQGRFYLDSAVSGEVVKKLTGCPVTDNRKADNGYGTLTKRELEVMRLLAEGFSPKIISDKLFISPKTVENHRANIMKKLGLHNSIELVRYASKLGLIDVDLWKG